MKKNETSKEFLERLIERHALQLILSGVGLLITIFNLFITIKLSPLVQNITSLTSRVEAIEIRNTKTDPLVERFFKIEEKVAGTEASVKRIEGKVDTIIEQHIQLRQELTQ